MSTKNSCEKREKSERKECRGMREDDRPCKQKVRGCKNHLSCRNWFCHQHRDQANFQKKMKKMESRIEKMEKTIENYEELEEKVENLEKNTDRSISSLYDKILKLKRNLKESYQI